MTHLQDIMPGCQKRVEQAIDHWIPSINRYPQNLHEAMRYSALGGGKRVRPLLVYATGMATGQPLERLDGVACAIELIHAYSLIHDDLPCMDDDDLRRGRPSCHKKFGEALAVLAGDALQTLAFHVLGHDDEITPDPAIRLEMIGILSQAAGSRGMAGGQAVDLAATGKTLSIAELEAMHIHKTGALIHAAVAMAVRNAENLDEEQGRALEHYAKCLGLAFQIRDDILDIIGDTDVIGKQSGADQQLNKPTFPELLGLQASKERARELHAEALDCLAGFDDNADVLRDIADYIVDRIR